YNLRMPPPVPLVPRARRLGVRERMRFDGTVAMPLAAASLDAAIRRLETAGVDSVAICYLHSYRNPRHEIETGRLVARRLPRAYVSLSSEVLPQIKEYERVWATVVNAYVGPALTRYLARLAAELRAQGYRGEVLIMQSHGGVAPVRESARLAAGAVLSGPAGGVAGGRYAARLLGEGNLVTFDMGGPSTDLALLERGRPRPTDAKRVGVAVARRLGTPVLSGAEGVSRVVTTSRAEGIRIVSVRRGVDSRRFALVAFGGAAGLHVTEVARLLEIRRVVVPSVAAVLSAWGMLATDLRYELVRSHVSEVGRMTAAGLRKLFATLEREGRKRLARFDGPVTVRRALDMRYGEQIFEIQVDLDGVDLQAADLMEQVA